ncbi:MAG: hypothetical protein JWP87_6476 [Labilithrix sp.]|nr:hypothetical protein [Labilithrix sp.]
MAKRTSESLTAPNGSPAIDQTAAIRGDIERTRGDMSRTVNEIEERLSPAHLKEQVANVTSGVKQDIEQKVADLKESVIGNYHETKDHLKDDLGRELRGAKHMVSDEITHARTAVHDATVGRVEHMVHDARDTVTDAGSSVLDTIKANPIPAALIGVGLGWLIFGARNSGSSERTMRPYRLSGGGSNERYGYGYDASYGYAEGRDEESFGRGPRRAMRRGQRAVDDAMHSAGEGVSNVGHRVQEGASHLAEGAQQTAHDVGQKVSHLAHDAEHRVEELAGGARDAAVHFAGDARMRGRRVVRGAGRQIRRAEQTVESTLRENPLAIGAVAIAIGAAIGLALPHTRVEDDWMGDTKDRLLNRAEGMAGQAIHRAEEAVGQLTSAQQGQGQDDKQGQQGQSQDKGQEYKNGLSNGVTGKSQAV